MGKRKKSTNRRDQLTKAQAEHLRTTLRGIRDEVFGGNIEQAREEFRVLERGFLKENVFIHRTKVFLEFAMEPESMQMLALFGKYDGELAGKVYDKERKAK